MKRILLRLCFLSSALAIIAMPMSAAEKPMNVVFILADDLGWSDTELYGHTKLYNTPNILRLAELLDIYPTLVDLADLR